MNVNAALSTAGTFASSGLDTANLNANITATGGISGDATAVTVDDNPSGQIQDGIDIAVAGTTINVLAGTYSESLVVNKSLHILGQNNAAVTLNAGGAGVAVNLGSATVELVGLRITNFASAGISTSGTTATITGNTIGSSTATAILINSGTVALQSTCCKTIPSPSTLPPGPPVQCPFTPTVSPTSMPAAPV